MIRIKLDRIQAAELALNYEVLTKQAAAKVALQDNTMFILLALHTYEMLDLLDVKIKKKSKSKDITFHMSYTAAVAFKASWEQIDTSKLPYLTFVVSKIVAQIEQHKEEMLTKIFGQPF